MALIEGLERSGKPLLHTSVSSVIADNARGDNASNQIFEDDSPFNLTKNLARGLCARGTRQRRRTRLCGHTMDTELAEKRRDKALPTAPS
jgi:hypothetical protein